MDAPKIAEDFEEQYRKGLLTEMGYRFMKSLLELDQELKEGDITIQGHEKKRKKLLDDVYNEDGKKGGSQQDDSTTSQASSSKTSIQESPLNVLAGLKTPSVHEKLNTLFNKRVNNKTSEGRLQLGSKGKGTKRSLSSKLAVETDMLLKKAKKEKAITVICVDCSAITIPRDKARLKSNGQMRLCLVSPSDDKEKISVKLNKAFGKPVKVVRATRSGDLFDAHDMDGEEVLDAIGGVCLYVKPCNIPSAIVKPQLVCQAYACSLDTAKPHELGQESDEVTTTIDWECFKFELSDSSLITSYRMNSDKYTINKEDDNELCDSIKHKDGDVLLCRNHLVDIWVDLLQATGNDVPNMSHHYYIVSQEMMISFDQFEDTIKKIVGDRCALRQNEITKLWMSKEKVTCGSIKIGNEVYHTFNFDDIDKLCDFVIEAQQKYQVN